MLARLPGLVVLALLLLANPWALRQLSSDHELLPGTLQRIYVLEALIFAAGILLVWQGPGLARRWAFLSTGTRAWLVALGASALWGALLAMHFVTYRTRFARLFHTGIEGSIPSVYSVVLFVGASWLAWQLAARRRRVALASFIILYFGADEAFEIHERLHSWQALLIWGALGAALVWSLWPALRVRWPLAVCTVLVIADLALDLGGTHWLETRYPIADGRFWRVLEDTFEVLASAALLGLLSLHASIQKKGRLAVALSPSADRT